MQSHDINKNPAFEELRDQTTCRFPRKTGEHSTPYLDKKVEPTESAEEEPITMRKPRGVNPNQSIEAMLVKAFGESEDHWIQNVPTHPVKKKNIFDESAETIAKYFSNKKVSPKGDGEAIRKLNFYINRAGKNGNPEKNAKVRHAMEIIRKKSGE